MRVVKHGPCLLPVLPAVCGGDTLLPSVTIGVSATETLWIRHVCASIAEFVLPSGYLTRKQMFHEQYVPFLADSLATQMSVCLCVF